MLELMYFILFWIFSFLFIILKSIKVNEFAIKNEIITRIANYSTLIKGIPALLAASFVFMIRPNESLFYIVLIGALLFCLAGDLGMEKGLIQGLPLFLIAQILFSITFIGQSLIQGLANESLLVSFFVFLCVIIYVVLFFKYLNSSENGLGKFKIPVIVYCGAIGLMLGSTVLLWTTLGFLNQITIGLISLGGFLFVFSDSVIALREFRGIKFSKDVLLVHTTYYSAIFLLSLSSIMV